MRYTRRTANMPDRVQRLRDAAQARHEATLRRAEHTVQRLADRGESITFRRAAELAGVSRSWLYRQHELRQQIDQLRDHSGTRARAAAPSAERATADSLRQQLHTYRAEITRLRGENQALREQLARRLGAERTAAITSGS
jgi:Family of unknown function (DUF6262)